MTARVTEERLINRSSVRHPVRWLAVLLLWLVLVLMTVSVAVVLLFGWLPPPASSLMIQRHFQDPEQTIRYVWVSFDAISPPMTLAAVAGEDQLFPEHAGFDFKAIQQALADRERGKPLRGASTISQQVAKNLFLWPGRSFVRKGLEAWFTLLMEFCWSKRRILEVYLNIVELGEYTFGVEAASWRFFNKPAQRLNGEEAALLAAVLPNPVLYRVEAPSAHVRKRQRWILKQMRQLGGNRYLKDL